MQVIGGVPEGSEFKRPARGVGAGSSRVGGRVGTAAGPMPGGAGPHLRPRHRLPRALCSTVPSPMAIGSPGTGPIQPLAQKISLARARESESARRIVPTGASEAAKREAYLPFFG